MLIGENTAVEGYLLCVCTQAMPGVLISRKALPRESLWFIVSSQQSLLTIVTSHVGLSIAESPS